MNVFRCQKQTVARLRISAPLILILLTRGDSNEVRQVKSQFRSVTVEKLEMFTVLYAVEEERYKRLGVLAVVRGALERVEKLVQSLVGQAVETLDAFINQVGSQLVNRSRSSLKSGHFRTQLWCLYTLTLTHSVGTICVKVQGPPPGKRGGPGSCRRECADVCSTITANNSYYEVLWSLEENPLIVCCLSFGFLVLLPGVEQCVVFV